MKYDAKTSRFLARAYNYLELTISEQDKINQALPRLGEELPRWIENWIKTNRRRVKELTPEYLR